MGTYSYTAPTMAKPKPVQYATIAQTGLYDIVGYGAQGGSPGFANGGDGAETGGYFNLVAGEKLKVVVGGAGQGGTNGAGGGGGSFVLASTDGGTTYSLLLASGGGGGASGFSDRGTNGGGGQSTAMPGSGNGGTAGGQYGAGGGAGFKTGGASGGGSNGRAAGGASSYTSSGAAGTFSGPGGFGGGGGGGNNGGGGGGGGYSGGNGGSGTNGFGTGGTSIDKGTPIAAQTLAAVRTANGLVTTTLALSIALANDTGSSNTDGLTKDDTVTGTARNAGTITFKDGSGNTLGSVMTTAANQTYSFNPGNKLAQGAGTITASETASGDAISSTVALTYDSTPPVDSSPTLTVAQNSGATPIGIGAPTDNVTPTASLAIVAGTLPSDGTVTLSDGRTAVTAGESLTSAQLTGLEFTPTPGASGQSSTFTYTVTDAAGNPSTGTATLNINSPPPPPPSVSTTPTPGPDSLTGTAGNDTIASAAEAGLADQGAEVRNQAQPIVAVRPRRLLAVAVAAHVRHHHSAAAGGQQRRYLAPGIGRAEKPVPQQHRRASRVAAQLAVQAHAVRLDRVFGEARDDGGRRTLAHRASPICACACPVCAVARASITGPEVTLPTGIRRSARGAPTSGQRRDAAATALRHVVCHSASQAPAGPCRPSGSGSSFGPPVRTCEPPVHPGHVEAWRGLGVSSPGSCPPPAARFASSVKLASAPRTRSPAPPWPPAVANTPPYPATPCRPQNQDGSQCRSTGSCFISSWFRTAGRTAGSPARSVRPASRKSSRIRRLCSVGHSRPPAVALW